MSGNKTIPTGAPVQRFLSEIPDERKWRDSLDLVGLMSSITGAQPKMWGSSIVGFGQYHYRYESGREGDCFLTGFSPRKSALTIYVMPGFSRYEERDVLEGIFRDSVARMRRKYDCS